MEFAKNEIVAIEETVNQAAKLELHELNELQLALVGGGCGDVVFA